MMRPSPATEKPRPRLISPWLLLLLAVPLLGLLALLLPRQSVLVLAPGERADGVSLAYAELLLRGNPDNHDLRLRLIAQLIELGRLAQASQHLALLGDDNLHGTAALLHIEVQLQTLLALPEEQRGDMRQRLLASLARLSRDADSDAATLQRLAEVALMLAAPGQAATIYQRLADISPQEQVRWLQLSARWYRAAGQQARTAAIYQRLFALASDPHERDALRFAVFDSLAAASQGLPALAWLDTQLEEMGASPGNIELLRQALNVARAIGARHQAEQYLLRWRTLAPDDPSLLRLDFEMAMGFGDIHRAWALREDLMRHYSGDAALLSQLAHLGQWVDEPVEAMTYWNQLVAITGSEEDLQQAWQLAELLYDQHSINQLLRQIAMRRELSDEEASALVSSFNGLAQPEKAADWLRLQASRQPGRRKLWSMLTRQLAEMQAMQQAADSWAGMNRHHQLSEQEHLRWAQLHWNQFAPEKAWDVLEATPGNSHSIEWWTLRGELAWALEKDEEMLESFSHLHESGQQLHSSQLGRMVMLLQDTDPERAIALLLETWERLHRYSHLRQAMQLAMQIEDWAMLRHLLAEGSQHAALQMDADPTSWLARLALARLQPGEAAIDELLASMQRRFPGQTWVVEQHLWILIDRADIASLRHRLPGWRPLALGNNRLWLPYAAALTLTGKPQEALYWYQRHVELDPDDLLASAAWADTLELAGRADSAWRLRRYLLGRWKQPDGEQPQRLQTWLRLLASYSGALQARNLAARELDGKAATLQMWFERQIGLLEAGNQPELRSQWLQWASMRGLKIDRAWRQQQDLRQWRRDALEEWLRQGNLPPETRVAMLDALGHGNAAQALALSETGQHNSAGLRARAASHLAEKPRGVQLASEERDHGSITEHSVELKAAMPVGERQLELRAASTRFDGESLLDPELIGQQQDLGLQLDSPRGSDAWQLRLDSSSNDLVSRNGLGLSYSWNTASRDSFSLDFDWQGRSDETALARALVARDRLQLRGSHRITSRDLLHWSLASQRYQVAEGENLASGELVTAGWTHRLLAHDPQWLVSSGAIWLNNDLTTDPLQIADQWLPASELMTDQYGEMYLSTTLQRGIPGAINRSVPGFSWKLGLRTGWQWTDQRLNWGIETGLGSALLGDDELAVLASYNSAPRGGSGAAGGMLRISYSLRLGR